ncbi:MAG: hypothetical protein AAFQ73_09485 [Pseudomonadota bacterium]
MDWSLVFEAIQTVAIGVAALALFEQSRQTALLRQSTDQQNTQIYVSTFNHFSNMYLSAMADLSTIDTADPRARASWWYRYWDIMCAEIIFHRKGYLDDVIFQTWMHELCVNLHKTPHDINEMGTFKEAMQGRIGLMRTIDGSVYNFLDRIEKGVHPNATGDEIRAVIKDAIRELTGK